MGFSEWKQKRKNALLQVIENTLKFKPPHGLRHLKMGFKKDMNRTWKAYDFPGSIRSTVAFEHMVFVHLEMFGTHFFLEMLEMVCHKKSSNISLHHKSRLGTGAKNSKSPPELSEADCPGKK